MSAPIPIPAEQVSAALHFLGVTPEDLVVAHLTPHKVIVKQIVRDDRGNIVADLIDPSQAATITTVHPVDYYPTDPTKVLVVEPSNEATT